MTQTTPQPALQRLLDALLEQASAQAVLLLERSGKRLGSSGDLLALDLATLSTASTGFRSAAAALARSLGESGFQELYARGVKTDTFLLEVDLNTVILVLFDQRSNLGLVRHKARRAQQEFTALLNNEPQTAQVLSPEDYENLWG